MKQNPGQLCSNQFLVKKAPKPILTIAVLLLQLIQPAHAQIPGSTRWKLRAPLHVFSSPAIASDGTIYIGTGTDIDPSFSAGQLYSIAPDGSTNWVINVPKSVRSSPAIGADGRIYVGCMNGELKIVQPGGEYKVVSLGGQIPGSPAIGADGTVYIGTFSNYWSKLYALTPDGTVRWAFQMGRTQNELPEQFSSPAIGPDGTIYVGSTDRNLYAISSEGHANWIFPLVTSTNRSLASAAATYSSPAIASDGTIYIGADNGVLYAIAPNGLEKWEFQTAGIVESSPAIGADGTIYVGSLGGFLYAVTPGGTPKWSFQTGPISSSPALTADGTIYVATWLTKQFFAFDASGSNIWTFTTACDTSDYLFSSPAIGLDGTIYFGLGHWILALNGSAGPLQSSWSMFRANLSHTARSIQRQISQPRILANNRWQIDLGVEPGRNYRVDWSTNLVDWNVLTNAVSITCTNQIFDTVEGSGNRYYRLSTVR